MDIFLVAATCVIYHFSFYIFFLNAQKHLHWFELIQVRNPGKTWKWKTNKWSALNNTTADHKSRDTSELSLLFPGVTTWTIAYRPRCPDVAFREQNLQPWWQSCELLSGVSDRYYRMFLFLLSTFLVWIRHRFSLYNIMHTISYAFLFLLLNLTYYCTVTALLIWPLILCLIYLISLSSIVFSSSLCF